MFFNLSALGNVQSAVLRDTLTFLPELVLCFAISSIGRAIYSRLAIRT